MAAGLLDYTKSRPLPVARFLRIAACVVVLYVSTSVLNYRPWTASISYAAEQSVAVQEALRAQLGMNSVPLAAKDASGQQTLESPELPEASKAVELVLTTFDRFQQYVQDTESSLIHTKAGLGHPEGCQAYQGM